MSRTFVIALSAVVVVGLTADGRAVAAPGVQAGVRAGTPELSTASRLQDRREVVAGTRAYSVGFEDGRFYANGWHITGEMGGVWTPPLKLVDGVWFGLDGQWVGPRPGSPAGGVMPATTCRTRLVYGSSAPISCPTGAARRCSG